MEAGWRRISTALLLLSSTLTQYTIATECENSCGTPEGISFCKHIEFATCRTRESWQDQDTAAANGFMAMMNIDNTSIYLDEEGSFSGFSNVHPQSNKYLMNETDPCHVIMRRLQCALNFPVCEIGSDYNRLCQKSCRDALKNRCPQLAGFCSSVPVDLFESGAKCFQVDYNGPAVGMWIAGFSISLVFSILNAVGINLQKYSLSQNTNSNKTSFQQPLWVLGMVLVTLGSILDFVAFGMAPQTLLAPLAALSLVWNMFIAPFFHKEKVTRRNLIATGIIFVGVLLTVIFAGHSTPTYDLEDLILLYQTPVMTAYIICVVLFLASMFAATRYIEKNHVYEDGFFHIVCYGGIAGTFGGQSVLLAKSTVELLKSAIWGDGADAFYHVTTYVIITGLVTCLLSQITFLNGGLKRFDALVVIPVYQSFWILMSVLGGIMYFQEYISMTSLEKYMFTAGGVITISGIVFLLQDSNVGGGHPTTGTTSGKYVELANSATPSDAWNTDDSDEEQLQQKLDDDLDEVVLDSGYLGSPRNPKTQVSPTDVLFEENTDKKTRKKDETFEDPIDMASANVAAISAAFSLFILIFIAFSRWSIGQLTSEMMSSQMGAILSAGCTSYILVRTLYTKEKRFLRHPNPMLFWKSTADWIYSMHICSQGLVLSNPFLIASIAQSTLYSSESWFVLMSYDLYTCGTNPFQNTKKNTKLYHGIAWGVGIVAGISSYIYYKDNGITPQTNEWWLGLYYIFVLGCVFCACTCLVLENRSQPRGGIKEALKTRGTILQASRTFTIAYALYQFLLLALWTIMMRTWAPGSKEYIFAHNTFNFVVGARGLIDLITWYVINLSVPMATRVGESSTNEFNDIDVALYPEFNVALRKEVLHFSTRGIVAASISTDGLAGIHRRIQLHLHELGIDIRFDSYYPILFRDIRKGYELSEKMYRESFLSTCHERIGPGGSSGAFMFYTTDYLFLVKTITKQERRVLLKMLPAYIRYLKHTPSTHLTRYYGCHSIQMYGQKFYFVVMSNVIGQTSMHQFYDIKGSWVNRNVKTAPPGELQLCAFCNCTFPSGSKQLCDMSIYGTHSPHRVLKDNDFRRKLRLPIETSNELLNQLEKDSQFLYEQGIMDYSLLLSIHSTQFIVDATSMHLSPSSRHRRQSKSAYCYPDPEASHTHSSSHVSENESSPNVDAFKRNCRYSIYEDVCTPLASSVHRSSVDFGTFDKETSDRMEMCSPWSGIRVLEKPGYRASAVVGPDYYTLGIVDMLQTWTWQKQFERWWKVYVLRQNGDGISAAPPKAYALRFQGKMKDIMAVPTAVGFGYQ